MFFLQHCPVVSPVPPYIEGWPWLPACLPSPLSCCHRNFLCTLSGFLFSRSLFWEPQSTALGSPLTSCCPLSPTKFMVSQGTTIPKSCLFVHQAHHLAEFRTLLGRRSLLSCLRLHSELWPDLAALLSNLRTPWAQLRGPNGTSCSFPPTAGVTLTSASHKEYTALFYRKAKGEAEAKQGAL